MTDLPFGWVRTSLNQVCHVILGQSPPGATYNDNGVGLPFFQGKAEFGELYPTAVKWCSEPTKVAEAEDVLISVRAPVGPTNLCPEQSCIGRGLAALRPLCGIPSRYVLYALRNIESKLPELGTGSTFLAISGDVLRALELPLAPLAEQHRIVAAIEEHLSRLDAAVAGLKRVQAQLPRYRAAVLKAAVEGRLLPTDAAPKDDGTELPAGWRWDSVANLAERVDYGTSAKTGEQGDVPVLRMGNIRDGALVLDSLKYLPAAHPEFPQLLLEPGDVLFNRTNSAELVGKSAVYTGHPNPCAFASYLIRIRLKPGCLPSYLAAAINSDYGRRWISEVVSQQVGQANVSGGKLKALRIPLPPVREQETLEGEIDRSFSLSTVVHEEVGKDLLHADRVRQAILRQAFRGRLVPQDPNDEPASVLLERIRTSGANEPVSRRRGRRARPAARDTERFTDWSAETLTILPPAHEGG